MSAKDGQPASPSAVPARLLVNVADLRRRLGQRREEPIEVRLVPEQVIATRNTAEPVVGSVTVESIERGVSVYGSVTAGWVGECRRCLEETDGQLVVEIDEIFQIDAAEDSELLPLDTDQIDLVPLVREAVVLSLPLVPLCSAECVGPDPDRYPARPADDFEADKPATDPRWAALDQLNLD